MPRPRQKIKCRAKSKRPPHLPCGSWALEGVDLCRFHGGTTAQKQCEANITHGGRSAYIRKDQLPEILAAAKKLASRAGRAEFVQIRAALTEMLADKVSSAIENNSPEALKLEPQAALDLALKAEDRLTKHVALLHEMDSEEVQTAPTTIVVANYDPQKGAVFQGRGLDGPVHMRLLDDKPFMLDSATGAWWPALEQTDEESGASYYTRLLELEG
jgi:predicted RNA-binding protein YlxR (DUF448 family)